MTSCSLTGKTSSNLETNKKWLIPKNPGMSWGRDFLEPSYSGDRIGSLLGGWIMFNVSSYLSRRMGLLISHRKCRRFSQICSALNRTSRFLGSVPHHLLWASDRRRCWLHRGRLAANNVDKNAPCKEKLFIDSITPKKIPPSSWDGENFHHLKFFKNCLELQTTTF